MPMTVSNTVSNKTIKYNPTIEKVSKKPVGELINFMQTYYEPTRPDIRKNCQGSPEAICNKLRHDKLRHDKLWGSTRDLLAPITFV